MWNKLKEIFAAEKEVEDITSDNAIATILVRAAKTDNEYTENAYKMIGAGLALGLAGIGTGLSQGPIGAAAVGMIAEDEKKFTYGLIFTALPETIVLFGFLAIFLL